jgi:hypothetical protein
MPDTPARMVQVFQNGVLNFSIASAIQSLYFAALKPPMPEGTRRRSQNKKSRYFETQVQNGITSARS